MNRHERRKARAHIAKAVRLIARGKIEEAAQHCQRTGTPPRVVERVVRGLYEKRTGRASATDGTPVTLNAPDTAATLENVRHG